MNKFILRVIVFLLLTTKAYSEGNIDVKGRLEQKSIFNFNSNYQTKFFGNARISVQDHELTYGSAIKANLDKRSYVSIEDLFIYGETDNLRVTFGRTKGRFGDFFHYGLPKNGKGSFFSDVTNNHTVELVSPTTSENAQIIFYGESFSLAGSYGKHYLPKDETLNKTLEVSGEYIFNFGSAEFALDGAIKRNDLSTKEYSDIFNVGATANVDNFGISMIYGTEHNQILDNKYNNTVKLKGQYYFNKKVDMSAYYNFKKVINPEPHSEENSSKARQSFGAGLDYSVSDSISVGSGVVYSLDKREFEQNSGDISVIMGTSLNF